MDMVAPRLDAEDTAETELELKLTTTPEHLSTLLRSISKAGGVDPKSRATQRLVSTYFDTEDRRLRRKGLTLRVRDKGGKFTQTVKSEGIAVSGVFARQEWSAPVKSKEPDLTKIKCSELHGRMGLILPQELRPLFKTDVKRTTMVVHHSLGLGNSAKIELAFDKGRVVSGKKKSDIAEVELELMSGTTTALIDLARRLAGMAPTVLNLSSKVRRGFELCDDVKPRAVTAFDKVLPKQVTVEQGMTLIFRSGLNHLLANRSAAVAGDDIEGVHQARVAIRRVKSAFSVFRHVLSKDDIAAFKSDTGWMMDAMGPARDLDVFLDEVLAVVKTDRPDDPDLDALAKAAHKMRTAAYRRVRSVLTSSRYTKCALSLAAWVEGRGWRAAQSNVGLNEPLQTTAGKLLSHKHRKVMKLGRNFETLSTDQRHEVRIALKKLRYSAEFFSGLYSTPKSRPYVSALKGMQNALGALNDVAVAEVLTQKIVASVKPGSKDALAVQSGAGKVLGWHTRAATDAEADMIERWSAFAETRPFWLES